MDWTNERYVRIYTRDTTAMLMLAWDELHLFWGLLRKLDRAGVLDLEGHGPAAVAAHLRCPVDVAERSVAAWRRVGWIEIHGEKLVVPTHIEAQEAIQSDRLRAQESRARRRDRLRATVTLRDANVTPRDSDVTNRDASVTPGHAASRAVTPCHSDPCRAVPCNAVHGRGNTRPRKKPVGPMPSDWQPRPEERSLATELGLSADAEEADFSDWTAAKGQQYADWDRAFASHLRRAAKRGGVPARQSPPGKPLGRLARMRAELQAAEELAQRTGRPDHWLAVDGLRRDVAHECQWQEERREERKREAAEG